MNSSLWNLRSWNGLAFGIIVVLMVHLSAGTDSGRINEPWPKLLSGEPASVDPGVAALQQRANVSLDNLVRSARVLEQPL